MTIWFFSDISITFHTFYSVKTHFSGRKTDLNFNLFKLRIRDGKSRRLCHAIEVPTRGRMRNAQDSINEEKKKPLRRNTWNNNNNHTHNMYDKKKTRKHKRARSMWCIRQQQQQKQHRRQLKKVNQQPSPINEYDQVLFFIGNSMDCCFLSLLFDQCCHLLQSSSSSSLLSLLLFIVGWEMMEQRIYPFIRTHARNTFVFSHLQSPSEYKTIVVCLYFFVVFFFCFSLYFALF